MKLSNRKRGDHRQNAWGVSALLVVYDVIAVTLSYYLALWLRFDCTFSLIGGQYLSAWTRFIPI